MLGGAFQILLVGKWGARAGCVHYAPAPPHPVVIPGGLITSTIDGLGLSPALAWRHGRRPAAA